MGIGFLKALNISKKLDDETKNNDNWDNLSISCRKILCEGDSLTAGSGGSSYVDYLSPRIRYELGDGSMGLHMIDNSIATEEGISFNKSAGFLYMNSQSFDLEPTKYSINGMGVYCTNGAGEYFTWNPGNNYYTKCRLYYLKQPGGGTFKFGYNGYNVSTFPVTDTNNATYDIGYIDLATPDVTGTVIAKVTAATGKVAIFGIEFYNATGCYVSRLAKGGETLAQHSLLDSDFKTKWINLLQPDLYIINIGMNDRNTMDVNTYKNKIKSMISQLKAGKTDINIILVACNQPNDYATSNLPSYKQALIEIANDNINVKFQDNSVYLGNYSKAVSNSLMSDSVHPNSTGNAIIAKAILKKMGIQPNGSTLGITVKPF